MKKTTTLLMAFALGLFAFAQEESASTEENTTNQTEEQQDEPKDEEGPRKFRSVSVGIDVGQSLLFGDMYVFEGNKRDINDKHNDRGGFEGGFTVNMAKWYSTAFGLQGRLGWLGYSGTSGIYSMWAEAMRADAKFMLNLSGIGANNRKKERKNAWIIYGGLGYSWANAWVARNGEDILQLGDGNYPQFGDIGGGRSETVHNTVYLPFGFEWRHRIGERWDIKVGIDNSWALDDNLDGSETVVKNDIRKEPDNPDVVNLAFGNTTNDFLTYFHVGANYWFSFKDHNNPAPIIFADGFSELENRVDELEENQEKLMADEDGDGVSDHFDQDPNTPEGYRVYGNGLAVDQDQDGIADDVDEDPFSTPGAPVTATGRELDDDGDGVPNGKDLEPGTKPGAFVNHQGATIVDNIGGAGAAGQEAFLPSVYFDFDDSKVSSSNAQRLATVARFLEANPDVKLKIVGHTDKVGGEKYNHKLSDRRAKAVMMALVNDFGIDESRLESEGKGNTMLVSKRNDINRRVEFKFKK